MLRDGGTDSFWEYGGGGARNRLQQRREKVPQKAGHALPCASKEQEKAGGR